MALSERADLNLQCFQNRMNLGSAGQELNTIWSGSLLFGKEAPEHISRPF